MEFKREKKLNNVKVVGRVESIERREMDNKGVPVVAGHILVRHGDSVVRVEYYEMKTWKSGTMVNEKYGKINNMNEGDLVAFACSLEENKFVARDGSLVSHQRLSLNFINDVRQTDEEGTYFDILGVVLQPLKEVKNEEGVITNYTIKLGQAPQYQPENRPAKGYSIITLDVQPENATVVNGAEKHYLTGTTVRVAGHAQVIVENVKEVIESVFGDDEVRISHKFDSKFYIDKGLRTMPNEEYTDEEKQYLERSTIEENERLAEEAANKPAENTSSSTANSADGLSGLLGL